jgi:small subunit ribosomal protein S6
MPFCFAPRFASATRIVSERGGSRERGFSLRTESSARFYELMSISVPDGTPEELIETAEAVSGYVTSAGGRIIRTSNDSPWGRRRLAYPIRHNSADLRDGFYTLYHFEIQPEGIESIEREIRLNERIIRHLLLTLAGEPVFIEEEEEAAEVEGAEGGEPADAAEPAESTAAEPTEPEASTEPAEASAPTEVEAPAEVDAPAEAAAVEASAPVEDAPETVADEVEVGASEEE